MKPPAPSDNETPKVPSIKVPAPSTPQQSQSNAQNNDNAAGANGGGFNAGERTTVSEPAPQAGTAKVVLAATAPAEQPAAETVSIDDDATPMVARVGGAQPQALDAMCAYAAERERAGDFTFHDARLEIRFWECLRAPKDPLVSGEDARALIAEHPADRLKRGRTEP